MSDKADDDTITPGEAGDAPVGTAPGDGKAGVGAHGGTAGDAVERMLRSDYAGNSMLVRLMEMPLDAALRVRVDGRDHVVWRMIVSDGVLFVHTNPVIAFAGPYVDGACVPYDVSCAIAATVNHRVLDGIVAVLPDGSVRDVSANDLVCMDTEG